MPTYSSPKCCLNVIQFLLVWNWAAKRFCSPKTCESQGEIEVVADDVLMMRDGEASRSMDEVALSKA